MDKRKRSSRPWVLVVVATLSLALVSTRRPAPDRPSERFSVLVHATASVEDEPDMPYAMAEVADEVARRSKTGTSDSS